NSGNNALSQSTSPVTVNNSVICGAANIFLNYSGNIIVNNSILFSLQDTFNQNTNSGNSSTLTITITNSILISLRPLGTGTSLIARGACFPYGTVTITGSQIYAFGGYGTGAVGLQAGSTGL